jgi:glycosyltransferase involved in cell wall biosynthesis
LGLSAVNPVLISNTPDPSLFHSRGKIPFSTDRKIRIISSSWSDNPNKGLEIYQWLDQHLDFERFDYTFVGRIQTELKNIRYLDPMPSEPLADLMRQQDIYLTASRHDPCSNSLVEAMACGLPVLYLNNGGHPELAGEAGIGFESAEEIPEKLAQLINEYEARQSRICIPSISEIADAYLTLFVSP